MAPLVRIILRYASGALVTAGYFSPEAANELVDPELIGGIVMVLNEAWYIAARKYGWEK